MSQKKGGRFAFFQSVKDKFSPAHKEVLQEGALGQAGIHIEKDNDLRPRVQTLMAHRAMIEEGGNPDAEGLMDTIALPWGTSYDSEAFYVAYKAGKELAHYEKWLRSPDSDSDDPKKRDLAVQLHSVLASNIQADIMKVVALSHKEVHVNPRSAIVIQTTPPINMGGLGPGRPSTLDFDKLALEDKKRRDGTNVTANQ